MCLGIPLTLVIIKKELAELDWLGILLFASLGIFFFLLMWMLLIDQQFKE